MEALQNRLPGPVYNEDLLRLNLSQQIERLKALARDKAVGPDLTALQVALVEVMMKERYVVRGWIDPANRRAF